MFVVKDRKASSTHADVLIIPPLGSGLIGFRTVIRLVAV